MHVMDTELALKSNVARKGLAYALQVPRAYLRLLASTADYASSPPVIVNSIPKSGTHLLLQIARALPDTRYFGSFVAWASSLRLVARDQTAIDRMLRRITPGEVIGAHLHFSQATADALSRVNAVHWLIIRDPVDVLLSEMHYLLHMNRFHRMAREFKGQDDAQAFDLALNGSKRHSDLFPPFEQRIEPYIGWLEHPYVTVVQYEDFNETTIRSDAVARLVAAWARRNTGPEPDVTALTQAAEAMIMPEKSHTFSGRQRNRDPAIGDDVMARLQGLRARLGYAG